jgi:DNA-binding transcriptional LysR family regulator
MKSDSYELQHGAAMSGSGLAVLPRFRADCEPELRRVAVPLPPPAAEIWLGVHRDNRKNPRVRVVLDTIAAAVRSRAFDLDPAAVRSVPTNAAD